MPLDRSIRSPSGDPKPTKLPLAFSVALWYTEFRKNEHMFLFAFFCILQERNGIPIMKLLDYYERYPLRKREIDRLEGLLRSLPNEEHEEREWLLRQIEDARAEMEEIRMTLTHYADLPANAGWRERYHRSNEKLFLECRFIQGFTVEKTAEVMCVSRDTAFRIRRRLAKLEIPLPGTAGELPAA